MMRLRLARQTRPVCTRAGGTDRMCQRQPGAEHRPRQRRSGRLHRRQTGTGTHPGGARPACANHRKPCWRSLWGERGRPAGLEQQPIPAGLLAQGWAEAADAAQAGRIANPIFDFERMTAGRNWA